MKIRFVHIVTIVVITISIVASSGLFYWYELRPASFRRECSWVKVVDEAVPAITKEEVEASKREYDKCMKDLPEPLDNNQFGNLDRLLTKGSCKRLIKDEREAKPGGEWYREATGKEYTRCLHQKGL